METHFASAQRTDTRKLAAEIETVSNNPVMSGILRSVSGLLAILDKNRQIIALNDSLIDMLGIDDAGQSLGLRPGEILECEHADDEPAGCGTTEFCSTCGAAVAIVSSLEQSTPFERRCALRANRNGSKVDIVLLVRAQPVKIEDHQFVLLFLQDITRQEQRAALERLFYHDVNNILNMLVQASELLVIDNPSTLATTVNNAAFRLLKEVAIQRCLSESTANTYQPMWDEFTTEQIFRELKSFFDNHPAANGKKLEFNEYAPAFPLKSDRSLLLRVLCNMVINALEASENNGVVRVWLEKEDDYYSFCVWNAQEVPPDIARRIFQRNFSTKAQSGRGIGTYSMKLFGEEILGGKVNFTSSRKAGTVFRYTHRTKR